MTKFPGDDSLSSQKEAVKKVPPPEPDDDHTEEILSLLVGAVADYAIFALDPNGNILTWNEGAQRLKQYSAEEVIGTHFSRFYTPADIERAHPQWELAEAVKSGAYQEEGWRLRKDGTKFWASVVITALFDRSGGLRGFGKVTRDLTLRKQEEERVKDSEERFRLLVTSVQDYAILTLDPAGYIKTWNAGAEKIKGYTASEIIGKHFSTFYTEEDIESGKPDMEIRIAIVEGRYEEEGWRVRKDSTLFWASVTITAIRDEKGELRGFAKVTRDLTARRQTEEALRQSQERYKLLVDSVRDYAIITLDTQGRVTGWNEGAKRIKGYDAKDILGTHFSIFYRKEEAGAGLPEQELRTATEIGRYEEEGIRVRKDGTTFWANVVLTPIRDLTGTLRGFAKVTRDITERKEAAQNLERKVAERTAELAREKERAEAAVKSREEFFSIASHELRTPLTSLKLKSQLAKRALGKGVPESELRQKFQTYVQESDEQLDRVIKLIEDMLDLTRVVRGQLAMNFEPADLSALTEATVNRFRSHFEEMMMPVQFLGSPSAVCLADPLRVEQVVTNLLTNVMRYAPKSAVEVSVLRDRDIVRISVKDYGPGIAPKFQEQIFNRYERFDPLNAAAGLGIGLYLSKTLVEAHQGTIRVESELGKGARFTVDLPALPSEHK
jgi:PAS domain S-box-containing protein